MRLVQPRPRTAARTGCGPGQFHADNTDGELSGVIAQRTVWHVLAAIRHGPAGAAQSLLFTRGAEHVHQIIFIPRRCFHRSGQGRFPDAHYLSLPRGTGARSRRAANRPSSTVAFSTLRRKSGGARKPLFHGLHGPVACPISRGSYCSSARMSSAVRAELKTASSSMTELKSLAFCSFSAMTFSSMVSRATMR